MKTITVVTIVMAVMGYGGHGSTGGTDEDSIGSSDVVMTDGVRQ